MPRTVSIAEKDEAVNLIKNGVSQREIARITGLSRPFIQKIAKRLGHQFQRNGFEIKGQVCMCSSCGVLIRRPPSKVKRSKHIFCSTACKGIFMTGEKNPSWKGGTQSSTFTKWVKNQKDYKEWRNAVLERDEHTCQITGKKNIPLDVHHIHPKADYQDLALDVDNGVTISQEAHRLIHSLIKKGCDFKEAIDKAKEELS